MGLRTSQDFSSFVGRTYEQANCWQLIREFYLSMFQVELKNYYDGPTPDRKDTQNLIYTNKGEFEKVEGQPEFGDIVLIKLHGIESHLAVYVGSDRLLHSVRTTGSVVEPVKKYEKLIVGFYRLKGLRRDQA